MTTQPLKSEVLAHFGLERDPFGKLNGAADYWQSPEFRRALGLVDYAIRHDEIVAVIGDIGSGKTDALAMIREAFAGRNAEPVDFIPVLVADKKALRITHVVDAILEHFAVEKVPASVMRRSIKARATLSSVESQGRRVCVLVDEAHRATGDFLKSFKELHEQLRWGMRASLFSAVLIGHKSLPERYAAVAPDVWARLDQQQVCTMGDMTPREVAEYITHRLQAVGGRRIFDEAAAQAIGRLAAAPIPVNRLCWRLMSAAYLENQRTVTEAAVLLAYDREALLEKLGLTQGGVVRLSGIPKSTVNDVFTGKGSKESEAAVDAVLRGALRGEVAHG